MSKKDRKAPELSGWQQIGEVPIDSGQLALVDPGNADLAAGYVMDTPLTFNSIENELGIPVAVVLATGSGDGRYPVEVRAYEEADGTLRIAEVRVRFL